MPDVHSRVRYEDFIARAPAVAAALREISKTAGEAGLDKRLVELVKVRASQINGCAFCLQLHLNFARKLVIIGGTSLMGGAGTVWGTLIGVIFLGVLVNGMTLLNISEYWQHVVRGALILAAVLINIRPAERK